MNLIRNELKILLNDLYDESSISEGENKEVYVTITEDNWNTCMQILSEKLFVLNLIFCVENFHRKRGFTLFYVFEKKEYPEFLILKRNIFDSTSASIAKIFPSANWFEREICDGFGIDFIDSFDKRRLFLHEGYNHNFHPLLKSFQNSPVKTRKEIMLEDEYPFKKIKGEGVYQIPVGPVHAGIIEPGHFRFSVIGETIFNLEIRMFFKHRGIEKLAEGEEVEDAIKISESISGDESIANALLYCDSVEKISHMQVPLRAQNMRLILLELERMHCHLSDISGMFVDVAYPVGASSLFILREDLYRWNDRFTGSRFGKGSIAIGGISKDISNKDLILFVTYLHSFAKKLKRIVKQCISSRSVSDRFENAGIVKKEIVIPLALSGPVCRARGFGYDTRLNHPYGQYKNIVPHIKLQEHGDALSRFNVKVSEIFDSIRLIEEAVIKSHDGQIKSNSINIQDGFVFSSVESARGQNLMFLQIRNKTIYRFKVRTASFCNWQAIEHAVIGNIIPDFPLINKSMNLSYAGTDL